MNGFNDESLIQEFLVESQEHLSSIEPDLLTLEEQASNVDDGIVNRIFRAIHSIKGAAGFFGFDNLKNFSHVMESVLMRIRDKQLSPESYVVDPLLKGCDKLREMIDNIQESETVDCAALQSELEHYMSKAEPYSKGGSTSSSEPVSKTETPIEAPKEVQANEVATAKKAEGLDFGDLTFSIPVEEAQKCINRGQHLFLITASRQVDCTDKNRTPAQLLEAVGSIGVVLGCSLPQDLYEEGPEQEFNILFGSVLEEMLLPAALDLPELAIKAYDATVQKTAAEVSLVTNEQQAPASVTPSGITPPSAPKPEAKKPTHPVKVQSGSDETIRVRVDLLNKLMDFAGELVLSRNQLIRAVSQDERHDEALSRIVQNVDLVTSSIQEHIMQTRMQPIDSVFRKFPRVVRDLANQVGKKITLEMSGQETELDKSILENLSDPLTHIIRNSCDHGLETPADRIKVGKPETGTIYLKAYHEGGQINIVIQDDGKGIDTQRVGRKAIEKGLITDAQFDAMSDQEQLNLIFHPGLSTQEQVSELSGRGVGMDVVRSNIEKLGGHVNLESTPGEGTRLTMQLPLTLAIIPSLVVGVQNNKFAIPQINLVELVRVRASEIAQKIERVGRASVLRLRGKLLPLVRLADIMGVERQYIDPKTSEPQRDRRRSIGDKRLETASGNDAQDTMPDTKRQRLESDYNVLVLRVGNNHYGLIVDAVYDTEEIVVKPLSSYLKQAKCFSGTTIMGDGKVAMILDAGGIANFAKLNFSEVEAEEQRRANEAKALGRSSLNDDETEKQAVILFTNHEAERFALPLSSLLRLEKINPDDVEIVGSREFITYRGRSMPLIRLEHYLPVRPSAMDMENAFLIVPKYGEGCAGIYASKILDTIETDAHLDQNLIQENELSGSAIVNGHLTLFVDAEALMERAGVLFESSFDEANIGLPYGSSASTAAL